MFSKMIKAVLGVLIFCFSLHAQTEIGECGDSIQRLKTEKLKESDLEHLFFCDERIEGSLINALESEVESIRLNAQRIIRILNLRAGMDKLLELYKRNPSKFAFVGPVPTPIHEVDKLRVRQKCGEGASRETCELSPDFLFSLSVDPTGFSKSLMYTPKLDSFGISGEAVDPSDLEQSLRKNFFFVSRAGKNAAVRILGFNQDRNKALLSIHINGGPLAESWYYVVAASDARGWRFVSLNEIAFT